MAHILVLENEKGIALLLDRVLGARGHQVTLLEDGDKALSVLVEGGIDLFLTDLFLQGMSGLEVVERYQEQGGTVPVVVISGHIDEQVKERLEACPLVCGWFRKPFGIADLIARVEASIEKDELEENQGDQLQEE